MVGMGREVADAYVSVHVDTSKLGPQVKRAAQKAGQQFGKDFTASSGREMDVFFSKVGREMQRSFGITGRESGTEFMDGMKDEIDSRMRHFDLNLGRAVISGDWSDVLAQFDDFDEGVVTVQRRLVALQQEEEKTGFTSNRLKESMKSLGASVEAIRFDTLLSDASQMNEEFDRQQKITQKLDYEETRRGIKRLGQAMKEEEQTLQQRIDKDHELAEGVERAAWAMNDSIDVMNRAAQKADTSRVRNQIAEYRDELTLANHELDRRIDKDHSLALVQNREIERSNRLWRAMRNYNGEISILGGLQGSRNDFIHGIGIVAGTTERALGKFIDRLLEIPAGLEKIGNAVRENGGGLTGFFGAMSQGINGMADSIDEAAIKLVALLATILAAVGPLGLMVSMLTNFVSGLAGIATALAGSAFFALSGFILALGPGLLALAAGLAATVTAFAGLEDQLDSTLQPITDWFKAVQEQVRAAIFPQLAGQIAGMSDTLNNFVGPLLVSSAQAFSNVIGYFVEALNRPEVQTTLATLGQTLPPILENLGRGFTDLVIGLLGFFAPISEQVVGLSGGFADLMAKFAEWANSKEGREEISEFFRKAVESMQVWGDLLGPLTEALGGLFTHGKETGDDFVRSLSTGVAKFVEWLNTEEGRARLSQWFKDAQALASDVAEVVGEIGTMIGELDTPANRKALSNALETLKNFIELAWTVFKWGSAWFAPVYSALVGIGKILQTIIDKVSLFLKLAGQARSSSTIPNAGGGGGTNPSFAASGMLLNSPTHLVAGEAGPEAVVPLNRPLSQVDPSVRALSAFAQGKGLYGEARSVNVHEGAIRIVNGADPYITAQRVVDNLAAMAY